MNTNSKCLQSLNSLGGVKLHIKAQDNRKPKNLNSISSNIQLVEKLFDMPVPNEFVECIEEIGAFTFKSSVNIRSSEHIPVADKNNRVSVDNIIDFSDDQASIIFTINSFKGNIPDHVMPIGEGEPGDLIVLDMSKANHGKVLYWYHEHPDESNGLFPLANSFTEFLEKLSNSPEEQGTQEGVTVSKVSDRFLNRLKKSGKI